MRIDVLALVNATETDLVAIGGQADLLDLHTQLTAAADPDPYTRDDFLDAADVINQLSLLLNGFPAADPRTVNLVVEAVIAGLRLGPLSRPADTRRFAAARAWLDNLRVQKRAAAADGS